MPRKRGAAAICSTAWQRISAAAGLWQPPAWRLAPCRLAGMQVWRKISPLGWNMARSGGGAGVAA